MKCNKCESQIQAESKFCPGCGVNVLAMSTNLNSKDEIEKFVKGLIQFGWSVEDRDEKWILITHPKTAYYYSIPFGVLLDERLLIMSHFIIKDGVGFSEVLNYVNDLNNRWCGARHVLPEQENLSEPIHAYVRAVLPIQTATSLDDLSNLLFELDAQLAHVHSHSGFDSILQ